LPTTTGSLQEKSTVESGELPAGDGEEEPDGGAVAVEVPIGEQLSMTSASKASAVFMTV
jgi:hypothetical protein